MYDNRPSNSPFAAFFEWVLQGIRKLSDAIDEKETPRSGRSSTWIPKDPSAPRVEADRGFATFPMKRSLGGHLVSGMRKIEQARRSSAINRKHGEIAATIQLTRRSIKALPRAERSMFNGYLDFLDDVRRREKVLFQQLIMVDGHLKRHDPAALREEIAQLEQYLASSSGPASRYEAESALAARRELLDHVQEFEERFSTIAAQMSHLCAMLDLNHLRIVSISTRASSSGADTSMQNQMEEMSIQLALLDESIRELDRW
jgi:hypothetical protein